MQLVQLVNVEGMEEPYILKACWPGNLFVQFVGLNELLTILKGNCLYEGCLMSNLNQGGKLAFKAVFHVEHVPLILKIGHYDNNCASASQIRVCFYSMTKIL